MPSFNNRKDNDKPTEQYRKLFIGGLSTKTDDDTLKNFYEQWGELVDCVVMKDRSTGRSRGFGFVTYKDMDCVDAAQDARPHEIDGKVVETKRAMPREEGSSETHATVNRLFVGGIKKDTTVEQLKEYFSKYGNITDAEHVCWRESGEPRGFGFLTFDDYDPIDRIILTKPHEILGKRVEVKKALTKEQISDIKKKEDRSSDNNNRNNQPSYGFERRLPPLEGGFLGDPGFGSPIRGYSDMRAPLYDIPRREDPWMRGGHPDDFPPRDYRDSVRSFGGPMRNSYASDRSAPYSRGGGSARGPNRRY